MNFGSWNSRFQVQACPFQVAIPASLLANLFGVAAKTAAEGESVEVATVGVYEMPKLASAVIGAGSRVAWDDTAKQVVLPSSGMVPIGIATIAAGNGVTAVRVRLDAVATAAA